MTEKVQHVHGAVAPIERDIGDLVPVTLGRHFEITPSGLKVTGEPSFEMCERLWQALRTLEKGIQFAIGDAVRYLERRFGEKASQIISDATGWSPSTIRAYEWVAEKVPEENRMMDRGLSYSHHQAVARLAPREQRTWLRRALEEEKPMPVARLKQEMKAGAELVETGWYLLVTCDSGKKRDQLQKRLELEGYTCRAETRREAKT